MKLPGPWGNGVIESVIVGGEPEAESPVTLTRSMCGGSTANGVAASGRARIMLGVAMVDTVSAIISSQVWRTVTADGLPPARYANAPSGKNAISFAGALSGIV